MKKKHKISVFGLVTLIALANIMYKMMTGKGIEFYEMMALGVFSMFFYMQLHGEIKRRRMVYFMMKNSGKELLRKARK